VKNIASNYVNEKDDQKMAKKMHHHLETSEIKFDQRLKKKYSFQKLPLKDNSESQNKSTIEISPQSIKKSKNHHKIHGESDKLLNKNKNNSIEETKNNFEFSVNPDNNGFVPIEAIKAKLAHLNSGLKFDSKLKNSQPRLSESEVNKILDSKVKQAASKMMRIEEELLRTFMPTMPLND